MSRTKRKQKRSADPRSLESRIRVVIADRAMSAFQINAALNDRRVDARKVTGFLRTTKCPRRKETTYKNGGHPVTIYGPWPREEA